MKKHIQSQTTERLYQHPEQQVVSVWLFLWVNLIDTLKMFAFWGTGLVLWYLSTYLVFMWSH